MKRGSELSAFQQINFKCIFKHPWSRNVNHIHQKTGYLFGPKHACLSKFRVSGDREYGLRILSVSSPCRFSEPAFEKNFYKGMERFPWSEASQFAVLLFAYDDQSLSLSIFNQWCGVFCKSKYLFESITICTIFLHTNQRTSQTETTLS